MIVLGSIALPEPPPRVTAEEVRVARAYLVTSAREHSRLGELPGWARVALHRDAAAMVAWWKREIETGPGRGVANVLEVLGMRDEWPWKTGEVNERCARGVHAYAGRDPERCVMCGMARVRNG